MRVALVHDWLTVNGGAEKVLAALIELYPQANLYTLVDFLPDEQRGWLKNISVQTSFIQKLPFAKSRYTHYLPLFPYAIEQFDLSNYELVISSSYCAAKGVITGPDQIHISYCHSPARYAWDLQPQYLKESGLEKGIKSVFARLFLHRFRNWDVRSSFGVGHFIANSNFIKRRIFKCYRREADVIAPPVELDRFVLNETKSDFYLAASRLVPYKRLDLVIKAFQAMPDKHLKVIGAGPEWQKLVALAKDYPNIELLGAVENHTMVETMGQAKAFIFAAEEDFGIISLEAQACGTPVIAYGKGGSLETVKAGVSGAFFYEQTVDAIREVVQNCDLTLFNSKSVRENALRFSVDAFKSKITAIVVKAQGEHALSQMTDS